MTPQTRMTFYDIYNFDIDSEFLIAEPDYDEQLRKALDDAYALLHQGVNAVMPYIIIFEHFMGDTDYPRDPEVEEYWASVYKYEGQRSIYDYYKDALILAGVNYDIIRFIKDNELTYYQEIVKAYSDYIQNHDLKELKHTIEEYINLEHEEEFAQWCKEKKNPEKNPNKKNKYLSWFYNIFKMT